MKRPLIFKTYLNRTVKKKVLLRGSLIGGLGALFIVLSGIFIPKQSLSFWGIPLFIFGFGLITLGLLPYRRLSKMELQPYELRLYENQLQYVLKNVLLTLPLVSIDRIEYQKVNHREGIVIYLKNQLPEKIVLHSSRNPFSAPYEFHPNGKYLFFPHFSQRTFLELKHQIEECHEVL